MQFQVWWDSLFNSEGITTLVARNAIPQCVLIFFNHSNHKINPANPLILESCPYKGEDCVRCARLAAGIFSTL